MEGPDATWRAAAATAWERDWPRGWYVEHVAETGSTNADLVERALHGAPARTVLAADHQHAGRGRLGRQWTAPPGANLLASILWRESLDRPHRLTQRIGLAAAAVVERLAGITVDLKWPNDLLVGGAKLAGILAQAGGRGGTVEFVVVGIGVNVGWAPDGAARTGEGTTPAEVLAGILGELDALPEDHFTMYRKRLSTLGQRVRVELPGEVAVGIAADVSADGALLVDTGERVRRIDSGDVVHLRPGE